MKFFNLLKKEIRELMTVQTIMTMFISLFAFYVIGNFMGDVMNDISEKATEITLCDLDNTEFTDDLMTTMRAAGTTVKEVELKSSDYVSELKELGLSSVIVIPKGFTDTVINKKDIGTVEYISTMDTLAMSGTISSAGSEAGLNIIQKAVKESLLSERYNYNEIIQLENPVVIVETTIVGDKSAQISASTLSSLASAQGVFVPIVIFILIMYASQMIISAISTEKIDKTLETLLSAPVSRVSVLSAKMLAAALVAALNATVYMFGFRSFMNGITGDALSENTNLSDTIAQLGLKLQNVDYVFLGIQMFMTILIALSISLILGALAKDVKSAQSLIMPIMFLAIIPYMLTMFVDISTLSPVIRTIVYAIPFTHTFIAIDNIIFAKDTLFWGGVVYQFAVLCLCMYFAVRLFTSDKIFTVSLSFGNKFKKSKSSQHAE